MVYHGHFGMMNGAPRMVERIKIVNTLEMETERNRL